jgi:DeoR family fructose operon transcriptional repressor
MLPSERYACIAEIIRQNGSVAVETLAKELGVSVMTIRRDLAKLDQEGLIERCYGGAVIRKETNYQEKKSLHAEEKKKIAQKAIEFVRDGDIVFLDAGTTVYEIAKLLPTKKDITAITTDLEIAYFLNQTDVETVICGGQIQKSTGSTIGVFVNMMIKDLYVNTAFFGAQSIDENFNILTPTAEKAVMKRTICEHANSRFLVVDRSKFYRQALMRVNNLSAYDGVITDKVFNAEEQEKLDRLGVHIIPVE